MIKKAKVSSESISHITMAGNTTMTLGARLVCFSNVLRTDVKRIFNKITNIELSDNANFMNNYIAALFLSHTDGKLFPGVFEKVACTEMRLGYKEKTFIRVSEKRFRQHCRS
ncbi:MAG TPA: ASKHA domain-containing protein [Thermodesulfobacteriota bacterium]|nr:ASKHA domain-containing protein [Thermodesulfobacteriota bacterium]